MIRLLNHVFWWIVRQFLNLRYRVRVEGGEALGRLSGPTLVLPNHPAYVDPAIIQSRILLHRPLRPLVFAGTYRIFFLRPLMWLANAFEVPDLSAHSRDAQAKTKQMIDAVAEQLQAGDCFLVYPSGRLQRGNQEVIGSARAAYELLVRTPAVNVVLIRTRGVWGSSFSCAQSGSLPNLPRALRSALGWLAAGLLFFVPRRPVTLHVEVVRRATLPLDSREQLNAFLEAWYNADGGQEPLFVRYHAWLGPTAGEFRRLDTAVSIDLAKIKPKTIEQVNELVQAHLGRHLSGDELQASTKLEALGLDSLDRMDLALKIEHQFGFRSQVVADSLGQLWGLADGQLPAGSEVRTQAPEKWFHPALPTHVPEILGSTVAESLVRRALQSLDQTAVADSISGTLTYRRFLVGATLMARQFQQLPGEHIGVLLPASVAADLVFFALHLAGKVPVMMNWTTGPANMAHGVKVTQVAHIVTSQKLIDRLGIDVPGAEFVFLEKLRGRISKLAALRTLAWTYLWPRSFLRLVIPRDVDEPAVFLFTSGSESFPKTVPLTHRNLLTNVQAGLEVLQATASDSLLGFLPPFHSFGLTGNVLLPLVAGVRCVRYPDPTDARGLVRIISAYRPTMVFTTPTFLGYILSVAQGDDLHSLQKVITGAEKCPEAIFAQCRQLAPHAQILEGYGITECSPVVAANPYGKTRAGSVGRPVKFVETRVVGIEDHQPVATNETGMLLVAGPSIFSGYYGHNGPSPFVSLEGKSWYKTGDLVAMDEEGYLFFKGRLKRFLKAGGEMISLPALEEPFLKRFPADENGQRVAVEGLETPDGRHIVLFTTFPLTLREASAILLEDGLRGVMRLDEVRVLEAIPVLGTGKTDYRQLRDLIQC